MLDPPSKTDLAASSSNLMGCLIFTNSAFEKSEIDFSCKYDDHFLALQVIQMAVKEHRMQWLAHLFVKSHLLSALGSGVTGRFLPFAFSPAACLTYFSAAASAAA